MTSHLLDHARANLDAALREEGNALANARKVADASGPASAESAQALRAAQAAHARSHAAVREVRALSADETRVAD